ncbi:hypothetical protein L2E82_39487 [Cichorium intybus]|uniref:Uncharacterized protein n=1 Tax=Cichorium intybus TaxID=13427 RepID=A0ACB9AJP5_CICIN|nr:hypothetical protein L2E82_39487 [Cichorium intybus]
MREKARFLFNALWAKLKLGLGKFLIGLVKLSKWVRLYDLQPKNVKLLINNEFEVDFSFSYLIFVFSSSIADSTVDSIVDFNADQDSNLDGATNPSATEGGSDANALLKRNSAGITRRKYHVAGIKGKGVAICNNASKEDKAVCATLLDKPKEKKKEKRKREEEMRAEVEIENEDNEFYVMSKRKRQNK